MNKHLFFAFLALTILVTACDSQESQESLVETKEPLLITTSLYPVNFFVSEIVKDRAEIFSLTPAGVEPHDHEPTPKDIQTMESSDLIVVNGNLEPWLEDLNGLLADKGVRLLILTEDMTLLEGGGLHEHHDEEEDATKDPHVWLDPLLAQKMVDILTLELQSLDPENGAFYETNANILKSKLLALDEQFTAGLASCEQDTFVTSHAAFAYLAQRYGLTQLPISGLSPDVEPSMLEIAQILDFVKDNNVKVIFFESLVSPELSTTIANEVGAETLVLNPIEGLMEQDLLQGKNYFTEMEQNLMNLRVALQCQ